MILSNISEMWVEILRQFQNISNKMVMYQLEWGRYSTLVRHQVMTIHHPGQSPITTHQNLDHWDNKTHSHLAVPNAEYTQKPLPDMQIADHAIEDS